MPVNPYSGEMYAESSVAVAEVFKNRVEQALNECPNTEPITEAYVVMGELAWDSCCGVVAAIPDRVFRTVSFPTPYTDHTNCDASLLAVDVIVVVLRCVPWDDPTPAQLNEAFAKIGTDAAVAYNAITGELPEGWERANVEQDTIGPQGGCLAVITTFTIGLPQSEWCIDCFPEEP